MKRYQLIVRSQINIGRTINDYDRKALNCYYVTPVFSIDYDCENIEVVDYGFEKFCNGKRRFLYVESVELVQVS